jgi:hypothetical protein
VLGLRSGRSLVSVRLPLVYVAPPLMAGSDCQYREADWAVSGLMAGTGRLQYGYPDCGLAQYLMQDSCSALGLAVGRALIASAGQCSAGHLEYMTLGTTVLVSPDRVVAHGSEVGQVYVLDVDVSRARYAC